MTHGVGDSVASPECRGRASRAVRSRLHDPRALAAWSACFLCIAVSIGLVSCADRDGRDTRGDADTGDAEAAAEESARVRVDFTRIEGPIAPTLLGYNSLWMFGGMGIWSAAETKPRDDVLDELEALGVRLLRYPGGTVSHTFHWWEAIGPVGDRRPQTIPFLEDDRFAGIVGGAKDGPSTTTSSGTSCQRTSPISSLPSNGCYTPSSQPGALSRGPEGGHRSRRRRSGTPRPSHLGTS